jgi:hypothetical protein
MVKTMAEYMHKLNGAEKAFICHAINTVSVKYHNVHPGILPFMPLQHVAHCLVCFQEHKRYCGQVLDILDWPQHDGLTTEFIIQLDDKKVLKRFGKHPERGKLMTNWMPIKQKRKRKMFERASDAYDMVAPTMKMVPTNKPGWWSVSVNPRYLRDARRFLRTYCCK